MNSVIIEKIEIQTENRVTLSEVKSKHLLETVKVKVGDKLKVTVLDQGIGSSVVSSVRDEIVELEITEAKEGLKFPITLIVAASRPPTMRKVIEHGTSMGVRKFIIVGADLTEKSYLQSKIYTSGEFKELTDLGLSQSVCFYKSPEITIVKNIFELPEEVFTNQSYLLSPYAQASILESEFNLQKPIYLAIGPERGWSKREVDFFKEKKFSDVFISPSILRVEIATIATLGLLNTRMKI
ncbi:RsmE family RNA methyltransferase [Bacteriovorax sp. Seq25_V]|uniref:RsmE family RNA methyltransferase n=1 Tax=Bacteriovorax sp. Seq25_V TaxID=1201288 RepID=UPI00038A4FA5|nr:RsmE family RNA methyltransferase [Bacteriovorax sp. Seq25_V]EQC44688.1 RNA methyltransferase, RsmE family [Bacteriovorax sp. Seq25_V]